MDGVGDRFGGVESVTPGRTGCVGGVAVIGTGIATKGRRRRSCVGGLHDWSRRLKLKRVALKLLQLKLLQLLLELVIQLG